MAASNKAIMLLAALLLALLASSEIAYALEEPELGEELGELASPYRKVAKPEKHALEERELGEELGEVTSDHSRAKPGKYKCKHPNYYCCKKYKGLCIKCCKYKHL